MSKKLAMKFYSKHSPKKGYSWETPPDPVPENQIVETIKSDVVVIGGGISGLAASARCAYKGLNVICIDKNKKMVALAGQIAAINTKKMAELGIYIDKKQFAADWLKVSGSRVQEDLLWLFINRSAEGFEWMLDIAGDAVDVGVYVGYKGPMFNEYLGTHHISRKKDCDTYKFAGGGLLACEILEKEFLKKGGRLFRATASEQLETDKNGRITGCVAKGEDGKYRRYEGRKAVVLATGDASACREMVEAFSPISLRPAKSMPRRNNTGDGQKMAYWAGAAIDNPEWAPTLHALGYCEYQFFYLHVNQLGQRFMNEDTWMQAKTVRCLMQPGGDFAFSVFDDKYLDEIGERWELLGGQGMAPLSVIGDKYDREGLKNQIEKFLKGKPMYDFLKEDEPDERNAFKADTLEELARLMDVPYENLKKTIDRYNELVSLGEDLDYGKRQVMMTPIVKPPFYALRWGPSLLDLFGGALTDAKLHVIAAEDSRPIPGLYAVGNVAGGMYAIDYPLLLNGNSYGRALAYAMQLADSILEE